MGVMCEYVSRGKYKFGTPHIIGIVEIICYFRK